jgi:hypothetical protein
VGKRGGDAGSSKLEIVARISIQRSEAVCGNTMRCPAMHRMAELTRACEA